MKESSIMKIAMIFSLIGLVALYLISGRIEVKDYTARINSNIGDDVKLKGIVKSVRKSDSAAFMEIEQAVPSTVVLFGKGGLNLTEGDFVEVIGEIQEFEGKEEIIANRIRVVR